MSWTKNEYHEEICAQMGGESEEMQWHFHTEIDETEINWFPDFRLAHNGYEEFDCELCGHPNTAPVPHKECHDRENAWSDAIDDLPF